MILIISTCKEKLHELEFVKPIEDILKKQGIKFRTINYKKLIKNQIKNTSKIIICGTSLKDDEYLKNISRFNFIKEYKNPILGICAGMQVFGLIKQKKSTLNKKTEIGLFNENFKKEFLGLRSNKQVYHLHNYYFDFKKLKEFETYTSNIPQAVKRKTLNHYGVLFHPEVRNKEVIINFLNI